MKRQHNLTDDIFSQRVAVGLQELDGTESVPDVSRRVVQQLVGGAPGRQRAASAFWPWLAALLAITVTAGLWWQSRTTASSGSGTAPAQQGPQGPLSGTGAAQDPLRLQSTDIALGHGYVRRDGAIHFLGGGTTGQGPDATRIDKPSQTVLRGFQLAGLGRFNTCQGLDAETFVALSEEYARDNTHVYYKVISPGVFLIIQLPEADPASFEVLARNLARDKKHVWYYENIQRRVDPATVVLVDDGRVFKDHDSVHYANEVISGADPASFRHLGSGYYADKRRIYWCTDPIPDADIATFMVLGDSFVAKDARRAYRSGQPLRRLDPSSLELVRHNPMGFQILVDKHGVYVNDRTFPHAGPGKFEVVDNFTVKARGVNSEELVLLVEMSRFHPVTVFRRGGKAMAATPIHEGTGGDPVGTIVAEITAAGLENLRIEPWPGTRQVPTAPQWQIDVLENPELLIRMRSAAARIL